MRKRTKEMKVRLTEEEYQEIEDTAKELGLTKQAYVLGAIEDAVIVPAEELKALCLKFAECNRQLRGLATNVNQMAHIANLYNKDNIKKLPSEYLLIEIYDQIQQYRKESDDNWLSIKCLLSQVKTTED